MEYKFKDEDDETRDQEARNLKVEEGEEPEEEIRKIKITVWAAVKSTNRLHEIESLVKELLSDEDVFIGVEDVSVNET